MIIGGGTTQSVGIYLGERQGGKFRKNCLKLSTYFRLYTRVTRRLLLKGSTSNFHWVFFQLVASRPNFQTIFDFSIPVSSNCDAVLESERKTEVQIVRVYSWRSCETWRGLRWWKGVRWMATAFEEKCLFIHCVMADILTVWTDTSQLIGRLRARRRCKLEWTKLMLFHGSEVD